MIFVQMNFFFSSSVTTSIFVLPIIEKKLNHNIFYDYEDPSISEEVPRARAACLYLAI